MSIAQIYLMHDLSSAANFRSWCEGLSLQLTACGWTKTSDTGQVDWTTTPAIPAGSTYGLYEIRQPASDPLQVGGTRYYIRIDYATQGSPQMPAIRLTLGTGTNGSGTLTGTILGPRVITYMGAHTLNTVPYECDFSWDASRLGVMMWRNGPDGASGFILGLERTKGADGTDTSDGITIITASSGGNNSYVNYWTQTLVFGVGAAPNLGSWPAILPALGGGTLTFNNNIPISPVFPCYGKHANPMTIFAVCQINDTLEGALLTTTLYGAARTYMMARNFAGVITGSWSNFLHGVCMRWD